MPTEEDDVIDDGLVDRMNLVSAKSNEKFFRERDERFEAALRRVTDCGDRPAVQIAAEALMEMSDDMPHPRRPKPRSVVDEIASLRRVVDAATALCANPAAASGLEAWSFTRSDFYALLASLAALEGKP